jgi:hypothetical protein
VGLFPTFLQVQALWNWQQAQRPGGGVRPTRAGAPGSAVPDQDMERLLLLSLIRMHLTRASTDALQALERDLQRGRTPADEPAARLAVT